MASCCELKQKELDLLTEKFIEFQSQAKEYEEILESENTDKENQINALQLKIEQIQSENQYIRKKYENDEIEILKLSNELDLTRKKLKSYEEQKRDLEDLNDQWEKSARILEYSKQELEERLNHAEEAAILYKEEYEELTMNKEIEVQRLKDQYNELKQELTANSEKKEESRSPKKTLKAEIVTIKETILIPSKPQSRSNSKMPSYNPSRGHSRKGSDMSVEDSQQVKVIVRIRPPLKEEIWDKSLLLIQSKQIQVKEQKPKSETKFFEFDNIISPDQGDESVIEHISETLEKVRSGKNACIMAYGQTGSGKTYTMNIVINNSIKQLGSIENAEVSLQCIEVYNEQIKDLINNEILKLKNKENIEVPETKLAGDWSERAISIINEAISRRTTKFTECNEHSSRSHAIFTLNIITQEFSSKIQFVDLAGSERIGKSKVAGQTLKEALLINKSLSALQDVISALENKSKHVPYRNSSLTKILQPTLGGTQSTVTMIMSCNPSSESIGETASTLALASRVKAVDLGFFIRKNLKTKEVERTLCLLEKERTEKNSLLRTLDKLQRDLESYQLALKDKDNKIAQLNKKTTGRDRVVGEVRNQKAEIKKTPSKRKVSEESSPGFSLLHMNTKELGRVFSMSPNIIKIPVSPSAKPTRIPTPSQINLKIGTPFKFN